MRQVQVVDLGLKAVIYVMKSRSADRHIMGAEVKCWARVYVNEKNRLTNRVFMTDAGPSEGKEYSYREYDSGTDSVTSPDRLCSFADKVEGASNENKEGVKAEIRAHFKADAIDLVARK